MLVTRSRHQAAELVELLEAAGAEAIEAPVLRVAELDDFEALDLALDTASQCDWIVFTTVNGVDGFMHRLMRPRPRRAGADRAAHLRRRRRHQRRGWPASASASIWPPRASGVDGIVAAMGGREGLAGRRVLMPSAAGGRDTLGEALTAAGADVRHAPAFRTLAAEDNPDIDVYGQLLQHRIDVVTFTSSAAVRGFAALYGEEQVADLLTHTTVATVGPAATDAIRRLGVTPAIVPAGAVDPGARRRHPRALPVASPARPRAFPEDRRDDHPSPLSPPPSARSPARSPAARRDRRRRRSTCW